MNLIMGDYNTLTVLRETEFAYMLGNEETEIFLHKKQITRELEDGENVEVFLYYDNQKRITATMTKPIVDLDNPGFLDVVDVNHRLGIFLNMGLIKDLLLSRDDLPFIRNEWPQKGDRLFVRLRVSKNQLTAKFVPRFDINKYLKATEDLEVGKEYVAFNVYKTEEGNIFFTEEGHSIYVYFKHMRKEYRLGEKETIKVSIDKGNYQYSGTINKQKEIIISADALIIKKYLEENDGVMEYTDKSSSDDISIVFHMSKSAFKRALGSLYKQGLVLLEKDKTSLVNIDK
ncbi:hypothetical protein KQ51_01621 [Candidatus Izimaplasma bacterium HR1]|jgi:predicted RNA-binding protein (virulence factor B family)|uniref:CvfB family protein n=1 Tax=Candidatus Izimoplasma sp. HR1 TaxID=1541959 RepID=UPI0004F86673|nr:hypothetical protein KQ51_01621 [Candidatus Izimaplasma bacterium HR1]